ncbi:MAG: protein kinase [Candidatus Eremiobacterota bacterium]
MRGLLIALGLFASAVAQEPCEVRVESRPPGAQVFDSSQNYRGTTPFVLIEDPRLSYVLTFRKDGYATEKVRVGPGQTRAQANLQPNRPLTIASEAFRRSPVLVIGVGVLALLSLGALLARRPRACEPEVTRFDLVGRSVDGYRVEEELGEGSTATVYRVARGEEGYALKLFHTRPRDARELERLYREMEVGRSLQHPNLARVHAFGELEEHPYLVMDLVDGETLEARLARSPLPPDQALEVIAQVARALESVHRLGVVHRDLKPSNIMLRPDGRAVLTDFGLARMNDRPRVTASGAALGTPAYMAPELLGPRRVDQRADLYSLGVILYEMLSGTRPFEGEDSFTVIASHLYESPVPLRERAPHVPPELEQAVMRLLAKDPEQRFRSVAELLQALPMP